MKSPVGKFQVPEAKGTQDFLGLNYYSVDTVSFHLGKPKELFTHSEFPADADMSDTNFIANIPDGFVRYDQMGGTDLSQPAHPHHREWRGRFRRSHASALSGAAYPPDVAGGQFQLAREGIFPLDAGG